MTNLFENKVFRIICILSLMLTIATPIAFATGIVEFSATPNTGSGTAPKQIPAATDAPEATEAPTETEAPEAATDAPEAATEAKVEILPFDWDSLANYPSETAHIEVSEKLPVTICVNHIESGEQIAQVKIPQSAWWVWIDRDHKFGQCLKPAPENLITVDLATVTDLTQFPWLIAVKVGYADMSPDVLWSPVHKYVKGKVLTIPPVEPDHGTTVVCMSRKVLVDEKVEMHYVMKTLTESMSYTITADGWDGDVYYGVTSLQVHNVQLACLHNMGENAKNPGSSTIYFETDNYVGIWYGRPAAP